MGVAVFPENGETMDALLRAADAALYEAKAAGRDRVVLSGDSEPADTVIPDARERK
jgi:PleD family two-component response regulator